MKLLKMLHVSATEQAKTIAGQHHFALVVSFIISIILKSRFHIYTGHSLLRNGILTNYTIMYTWSVESLALFTLPHDLIPRPLYSHFRCLTHFTQSLLSFLSTWPNQCNILVLITLHISTCFQISCIVSTLLRTHPTLPLHIHFCVLVN